MEIEWKTIITGILVFLVLIAVIFGLPPLLSKLGNSFLGITPFDNATSAKQGATFVQTFLKEVQQCQTSPDKECVCPFTSYGIPPGTFIEFKNDLGRRESTLTINQGTPIDPKGNLKEEKLPLIVATDQAWTPGLFGSYLDDSGKINVGRFTGEYEKIDLIPSTGKESPTTVQSIGGEYPLLSLVKITQDKIGLLPTPVRSTASHLDELKKVPVCNTNPESQIAKKIYNQMLQNLAECSSLQSLKEIKSEQLFPILIKRNTQAEDRFVVGVRYTLSGKQGSWVISAPLWISGGETIFTTMPPGDESDINTAIATLKQSLEGKTIEQGQEALKKFENEPTITLEHYKTGMTQGVALDELSKIEKERQTVTDQQAFCKRQDLSTIKMPDSWTIQCQTLFQGTACSLNQGSKVMQTDQLAVSLCLFGKRADFTTVTPFQSISVGTDTPLIEYYRNKQQVCIAPISTQEAIQLRAQERKQLEAL